MGRAWILAAGLVTLAGAAAAECPREGAGTLVAPGRMCDFAGGEVAVFLQRIDTAGARLRVRVGDGAGDYTLAREHPLELTSANRRWTIALAGADRRGVVLTVEDDSGKAP